MKQFFLCLTLLMGVQYAFAQQWAFEFWHDGKVVLESGDTLRGQVKYDLQQDVIQFTDKKGIVEAYTARKILFCEIFDGTTGQYRQFYSLPYNATSGYRTPVFFELIGEGKLTILCREHLENQTSSSAYYYGGGTYSRTILVNKYYMLEDDGDIIDFSTRKSDFMNFMGKHASSINAFMKQNKLKLENKLHLTKIIAYYNSLFKNP